MSESTSLAKLFEHKADADQRTVAAMQALSFEVQAAQIALRVLGHAWAVDRIFAGHLTGTDHGFTSANPAEQPDLETLGDRIARSDRWYVDYVRTLDRPALSRQLDFAFTDGDPGRMSREEMLLHVITHGVGHRGQISWMLTLASVAAPADGFAHYLHEAEGPDRRRAFATTVVDLAERIRPFLAEGIGFDRSLRFDLGEAGRLVIDGDQVATADRADRADRVGRRHRAGARAPTFQRLCCSGSVRPTPSR